MRVKLATPRRRPVESSAGFRSKFGLTLPKCWKCFDYLKQRDMADCLQLVHFHIGSQITNIRNIKAALTEAARIYVELYRVGAGVKYLDVGGGLGIDYDGSQSDFVSSVNYTLQEYANDVVFRIKNVCDEAEVPHPTIFSESGRAMVAYHSVLVFDVLGVSNFDHYQCRRKSPRTRRSRSPTCSASTAISPRKTILESYHDAVQAMDEAMSLFNLGHLTIEQRALAERLFWAFCSKLLNMVRELDYVPEELEGWKRRSRTPTSATSRSSSRCPIAGRSSSSSRSCRSTGWPKSRPAGRVLGDITCDSDGKIDQFIDLRDVRNTLELHPFDGQPYYLGAFLLGAYQEILGDLHNLFGDTNAVHVSLDENGEVELNAVVKGDTVREVLHYVQYSADEADRPACGRTWNAR